MAGSARKPYLRLKKSLVDFFRAPIVFIKQMNQKFSDFEKPYLESEYQQMHLEWPEWDWGSPRGGPRLPPSGPFGAVPKPFLMDCVIDCWHVMDCEDLVECFLVAYGTEGGEWKVSGDILSWEKVSKTITDVEIKLDSSVDIARMLIEYIEPDGGRCSANVEVTCVDCDSTATIGYTTLQMQVDESQTLTASLSGGGYTWAISSGGGSLSSGEGNSVDYTAPSSNAECSDNPTITLSCEEVVIDSITIAVNAVDSTAMPIMVYNCLYDDVTPWSYMYLFYKCDGTLAPPGGTCGITDCPTRCVTETCCCKGEGAYIGDVVDNRTEQQITDGCCPSQVL